jgi:hypothetical protein
MNSEGIGRDLFEVLSQNFPGASEEYHENSLSRELFSPMIFEPSALPNKSLERCV